MTITKARLAEIKARAEAATDDLSEIHRNLHFYRDDLNRSLENSPDRIHELRDLLFLEFSRADIPDLVAEVERLRMLLKQVERCRSVRGELVCSFCRGNRFKLDSLGQTQDPWHLPDCPVFTPEGEVR